MRGHSLREFVDFLNANDPGLKVNKSGHFAGLQRAPDPNSGTALWTMLTEPKDIEKALEARTSKRKAEELAGAGNTYTQEQLVAGGLACQGEDEKAAGQESARGTSNVEVAEARAETEVAGTSDLQQITRQLSKIQEDLTQRDGGKCTCIIG